MIRIKFEGEEADEHTVEAYYGAESLAAFARVATLSAHYAATGDVRHRGPYSDSLEFRIIGTREGSLEFLFEQFSRIRNEAQAASIKDRARKLLRRVVARATGQAELGELRAGDTVISAGDIDSLAEAATPAIERAHNWIDSRVKKIELINDDDGNAVSINQETKDYIKSEELGEEEAQDVSVAALNVNSKIGRIYFDDLGRTVPFKVERTANPRTVPTLSRYLTQYADRTGATVNIVFRRIMFPDGRLKKVLISDCYPVEDLN